VVNDPEGVRRAWGRLYLATCRPRWRARTVVSRSPEGIKTFLRELDGPAVLKPLAHADREKVFFLRRRQARNVNPIISAITKDGYAVAQEYLPEADAGEKRLLLLGGEPIRVGSQVALYRRLALAASGWPWVARGRPFAPAFGSAQPSQMVVRIRGGAGPKKQALLLLAGNLLLKFFFPKLFGWAGTGLF